MINFDKKIDIEDLEVMSICEAFKIVDGESIEFIHNITGNIVEILCYYDGNIWIGDHKYRIKRLVSEYAEVTEDNVDDYIAIAKEKYLDMMKGHR